MTLSFGATISRRGDMFSRMLSQTALQVGDIAVELLLKDIKHVHLRISPPMGEVRVSAPRRMSIGTIRAFVESKIDWIRRHQIRIRERALAEPDESADRESPSERRRRERLLLEGHRKQIQAAVPALLAHWEPIMGVKVERFFVRRMRTRWGSCSYKARTIRLNTELATKPAECLEYVVVHELVHLLEPSHNARFVAFMDRFMPEWRTHRRVLNPRPAR